MILVHSFELRAEVFEVIEQWLVRVTQLLNHLNRFQALFLLYVDLEVRNVEAYSLLGLGFVLDRLDEQSIVECLVWSPDYHHFLRGSFVTERF